MAVKIRLARMGRKKRPFYRIVVASSEAKRDGKYLEIVGTYDPMQEPAAISIKHDKLRVWLDQGAQPTETVRALIAKCPASEPAE
jgi:small subunit ribosomal protein S16